jgi:4a-hydroxytetrahydrobiopterin dehydratase
MTLADDWAGMTGRDVDVAQRITSVARELGVTSDPSRIQSVLFVIGTVASPAVMPFWRALLGYEYRADTPDEDLVDPRGRGPAVWFEPMDEPRPASGRIHVAVWVPAEHGEARVAAALAAGGRIVYDEKAPAWWTLADPEGNEADVATIATRD